LITENGGDDNRGVCFFRGLKIGRLRRIRLSARPVSSTLH